MNLEELRARIKASHERPQWHARATKVWERYSGPKPPRSRTLGVVADPRERTLVRKVLEAERSFVDHYKGELDWDGVSFARRRGTEWRDALARWQESRREQLVGAAGAGGDQDQCESCVAFATIAAIEGRLIRLDPVKYAGVDLSEAHLFFCGHGPDCSVGWNVPPAMKFVYRVGFVPEQDLPYSLANKVCPANLPILGKIERAELLNPKLEATKATIDSDGPVVAVMKAYEDFRAYGDMSVPYAHVSGAYLGLHAVTIVGHDATSWIGLNSWGGDWGTDGFFRILYGECEIEDSFFTAPVVTDSPP